MESFEQEKSSSGKYYYRNRRTGKTEWEINLLQK